MYVRSIDINMERLISFFKQTKLALEKYTY